MSATTNVLGGRGPAAAPRQRAKGRAVWEEQPTKVGQFGKGTVLTVVAALVIVPLWAVVMTSLSSAQTIAKAGGVLVLVPHGVTWNAYAAIFRDPTITHAVLVSVVITVVGTAFSMTVSILCAYGLSRARSFGHRTFLVAMIFTMFFSGGIIPTFLVVSELHGYDNYWALILPSSISVFNILIMRGFYQAASGELIDAARIDGANEFRILWSVVLPTTKAVTAVMTLFYAVGYWGSWFNVLLYMDFDNGKWPLAYVLYQYVIQGSSIPGTAVAGGAQGALQAANAPSELAISMAVVVLMLVPILLIYPFIQRHFTKGMLTGAIKG
ncbi:MAG TPA: carbohydrate ABC transporter permease [Actinocrinis sp.]|jgi:multiple sugar transport system permease protein/putative aldouronate transport system permease protein